MHSPAPSKSNDDHLELVDDDKEAGDRTHKPPERRRFILVGIQVTIACLLALFFLLVWSSQPISRDIQPSEPNPVVAPDTIVHPNPPRPPKLPTPPKLPVPPKLPIPPKSPIPPKTPKPLNPLDPLASVNGPATPSVYDNLRNDTRYITSWLDGGWTNDVMAYANLIYLGMISDRVPIIGRFIPGHISTAPEILVSEVFDLPRLRKIIKWPVLEWDDVKRYDSEVWDDIGCWSVWQTVWKERDGNPRRSDSPRIVKLDISYTPAPWWIKLLPPHFTDDPHATFWSLAALAFPESRNTSLGNPSQSPLHRANLHPNEHLVCYDYLYYVGAFSPYEYELDYSPAFRFVLQHMYWTEKLERLGNLYLHKTLGVPDSAPTPHYIVVQARRGDISQMCPGTKPSECFAPISAYAHRVEDVKRDLAGQKGLDVKHVIMTSDETDEAWWAEVKRQGWLRIDHSTTNQVHGVWYPALIEAVIQSHSTGYVGTERSTYSLMGARRCEAWHDCIIRMVRWGVPGADDHRRREIF